MVGISANDIGCQSVREPLFLLHEGHAETQFVIVVRPPSATGQTWSISITDGRPVQ